MVSALVPGLSGPDSSPGWEHCVVFLGKTPNSHSASLFQLLLGNFWENLTNSGGVTCNGLVSHSRGVEILLAASCY